MHESMERTGRAAALAWALVGLAACGAGSGAPEGTPDPDEGLVFTARIVASEGGTVATDQGWGLLTVPAGALAVDADITLTPLPRAEGTVTSTYEVGPGGLAFATAAVLSVVYDGSPPGSHEVVLAQRTDAGWEAIPGSSLGDGRLEGKVAGAGEYAGVARRRLPPETVDCVAVRTAFAPCGGDLIGTWRVGGACLAGADVPLDPSAYCPARTGTVRPDRSGTVTLTDKALTVYLDREAEATTFEAPATCFPDPDCRDVRTSEGWQVRCTPAGDACACDGSRELPVPVAAPVPARQEGNDLVLADALGAETSRLPYCVQGDSAVLRDTWAPSGGGPATGLLWVLTR